MRKWPNQARVLAFLAACFAAAPAVLGAEAAAPRDGRGTAGEELRARCDAAIASAVRSTYGWGWRADDAEAETDAAAEDKGAGKSPPKRAGTARKLPPIDGRETALVGVQLFWAGERLGEERYKQAAFEAARGLAAIQARSGQVRARGVMGAAGGTKEALTDVPDRSVTFAALGLWLTLIEADGREADRKDPAAREREDRQIRPAAMPATRWLTAQQTPAGAWPVAHPPDAPLGKANRIVRLDDPDYRDCALAILLAGELLGSRELRLSFERSLDHLLALRVVSGGGTARPLWGAAYDLSGQQLWKFKEFPGGVDLLASRRAMQVCLAAYLVTLKPKGEIALREAAEAVAVLRKEDGKWHRYFNWRGEPILPPQPATRPAHRLFQEEVRADVGTFGLDGVLRAAGEIGKAGGENYKRTLAADRPVNRRIVEMICGLSDDPLSGRLTEGTAAVGGGGPVNPLSGRTADLWRAICRENAENGNP